MFILDTNVLSAVMGSQPAAALAAWLAAQPPDELFTVSVCQAEILAGIAVLPKGRRRDGLQIAATSMFREDFVGRVLPFDADAAVMYAELFAARRRAGRPPAIADLIIASVARVRGASVVTRDAGGLPAASPSAASPLSIPGRPHDRPSKNQHRPSGVHECLARRTRAATARP